MTADDDKISLRQYVDLRFESQDRAVKSALDAAEKANLKTERSDERWRESANNWRGAMSDREKSFLTRQEFYGIISTAVIVIGLVIAFLQSKGN